MKSSFDVRQLDEAVQQDVAKAMEKAGVKTTSGRNDIITDLARNSLKTRDDMKMWKKAALRVGVGLLVALCANFGLVIWAMDLQKEVKMDGSALIANDGQHQIAQVATASTHLGLKYASVVDMEHLATVNEVKFKFSATGETVVEKVGRVSRLEDDEGLPTTTFTLLSTGDRLIVNPEKFALIPAHGVAGQVMERLFAGDDVGGVGEALGLNATEVGEIAESYMVCQGGGTDEQGEPVEDVADIDFDMSCNAFTVDDPALDVAALTAELESHAARRLGGGRRRQCGGDCWDHDAWWGCCSTDPTFLNNMHLIHKDKRMCQFTSKPKRNRRRRGFMGHRRRNGGRRRRRKASKAKSWLSDTCCMIHDVCLHDCDCTGLCPHGENGVGCECTGKGFCLCYSACDAVLFACASTPGHCLCDLKCRAVSYITQHAMLIGGQLRCVKAAGEAALR